MQSLKLLTKKFKVTSHIKKKEKFVEVSKKKIIATVHIPKIPENKKIIHMKKTSVNTTNIGTTFNRKKITIIQIQ